MNGQVEGSTQTLRENLIHTVNAKNKKNRPQIEAARKAALTTLTKHGECPQQFKYLWLYSVQLGKNFNWTDLLSWTQLRRVTLEAWEINMLNRLNAVRK